MAPGAYSLVLFDVDSTLVTIEGIDFLASGNQQVVELTSAAMNGTIPLEEVYGRRLDIIRPTAGQVAALGEEYVRCLLPDAREVVNELRQSGVEVHLLTAGIEQAVTRIASELGIAARQVHAVALRFDSEGNYVDYDRASPLTRTGGKEIVALDVRCRHKGRVAMIGDGVSDLEAKAAVDLFIGFGGVQIRDEVRARADVFVTEPRLRPILQYLES